MIIECRHDSVMLDNIDEDISWVGYIPADVQYPYLARFVRMSILNSAT